MKSSSIYQRPARLDNWYASLASLPGIGGKTAQLFDRLLGRSPARLLDLVFLLPRRVEALVGFDPDHLPAAGAVIQTDFVILSHHLSRQPKRPSKIKAEAQGVPVDLVFFRGPGMALAERFPVGSTVTLRGKLEEFRDQYQIVHPQMAATPMGSHDAGDGDAAFLVYPSTAGITQRQISRAMTAALAALPGLPEWREGTFELGEPSFGEAITGLHGLAGGSADGHPLDREVCRQRLAGDELLSLQLALALNRRWRDDEQAGRTLANPSGAPMRPKLVDDFIAGLPFQPTPAQSRVIAEIRDDMAAPKPMTRLLQGDVGAGKTMVATAAALGAIAAGGQAVLMAPTEILARQHAQSIRQLIGGLDVRVTLLFGSMAAGEKRAAQAEIAAGGTDLIIGTHALFQDAVSFARLRFVVIDEQHRFGVHQRLALRGKGAGVDLLLLTATPIPRSLIMTLYGDIAVSKLDMKPADRLPVKTTAMPQSKIGGVVAGIERALAQGGQVFWVCPLVAPSEALADDGLMDAVQRYEWLCGQLPGVAVALVHGQLPMDVRDQRMRAFASGEVQILVATTVIEVGVDVPAATVMVIENAERFGLAQLHQLRGRVGRGAAASHCVLLYQPPLGRVARARLELLRESQDGFLLAEEDLRLRGAGEVLGTKQSGLANFRFADLAHDLPLLAWAKAEAAEILARDPGLAMPISEPARILLHVFDRVESFNLTESG